MSTSVTLQKSPDIHELRPAKPLDEAASLTWRNAKLVSNE